MAQTSSSVSRTLVYVSTAVAGTIDAYRMDGATGTLTPISSVDVGPMVMPMAVSPDRRHLHAVIRVQPYRVLTLAIDPESGRLRQEAVAALPDSMAYVSLDPTGALLFAASYGGSKIAVMLIGKNGLVTAQAQQVIATGRNAHSIVSDRTGKYVFATNLGSDAVQQFTLDPETGILKPNDPIQVATGTGFGPRHIVISPDNKAVYVLTELTGHVIHYALDTDKGTLSEIESVASVPEHAGLSPGIAPPGPAVSGVSASAVASADNGKPKIWAADIGITPNGKFLYTTERTTSRIALFHVGSGDGRLTYVGNYPTEQQPRGIRIDPSGRFLVASGEKSDRLSVYAIDQADGGLDVVGRYPVNAGANWIEIVTFP
ncbi:lactonase family protein [Rhizobium hainanense]|uniref:6-phosphogluconolactonase n=1 Tax=Rhizobium hainanense TaxID=52131 RepID=A0A1C3W3D1_9HYPH|nr:beta-propeller fold lactonase family protein [Rhizobium hainanense]SCB34381.1 6-phosphogluconolactonase [Rhizobium hainanense]